MDLQPPQAGQQEGPPPPRSPPRGVCQTPPTFHEDGLSGRGGQRDGVVGGRFESDSGGISFVHLSPGKPEKRWAGKEGRISSISPGRGKGEPGRDGAKLSRGPEATLPGCEEPALGFGCASARKLPSKRQCMETGQARGVGWGGKRAPPARPPSLGAPKATSQDLKPEGWPFTKRPTHTHTPASFRRKRPRGKRPKGQPRPRCFPDLQGSRGVSVCVCGAQGAQARGRRVGLAWPKKWVGVRGRWTETFSPHPALRSENRRWAAGPSSRVWPGLPLFPSPLWTRGRGGRMWGSDPCPPSAAPLPGDPPPHPTAGPNGEPTATTEAMGRRRTGTPSGADTYTHTHTP